MKRKFISLITAVAMIAAFVVLPTAVSAVGFEPLELGDYVQMGTYYDEPILWRCVSFEKIVGYDSAGNPIVDSTQTATEYTEGYLPLLLSDKILCLKPLDASGSNSSGSHALDTGSGYTLRLCSDTTYKSLIANYSSNYWQDSNLNSWLNSNADSGNVWWRCGNPPYEEYVKNGYNEYDQEAGFLTNFTQNELNAMQTTVQKSIVAYPEWTAGIYDSGTTNHSQGLGAYTPDRTISGNVGNYDEAYSEQVTETVFLLDVKQADNVYNNSDVLGGNYYIGEPTEQCVANSEYTNSSLTADNKWQYWLRTPYIGYYSRGEYIDHCGGMIYIGTDGDVQYRTTSSGDVGVRPAFYLNLSAEHFISGVGSEKAPYAVEDDNYVKIGADTNQFTHNSMKYTIVNSEYKEKLLNELDNKIFPKYALNSLLDGESDGVCHGISLSICYGVLNLLDFNAFKAGAANYWGMGGPYASQDYKDMLVYYQLTQNTSSGAATKILNKGGWFKEKTLETRKQEFLQSFVAEAQRGQNEGIPFIFAYEEGDSGHSVVVCGYNWNEEDNCHEIQIYDVNCFSADNKDRMRYYTMTVSNEYDSFDFTDSNGLILGKKLQDNWTKLAYYGVDCVTGDIKRVASGEIRVGTTVIQLTSDKQFRMENDNGEWLVFNGADYTGTMAVYDCTLLGWDADSNYWEITVDESDSFTLTDMDEDFEFICEFDGQGYVCSGGGAESIVVTKDGIQFTGDEYVLNATFSSTECDMIGIQALASGNTTISAVDNNFIIESDDECDDVWVTAYDNLEKTVRHIDGSIETMTISASGEVDADVASVTTDIPEEGQVITSFDSIVSDWAAEEVEEAYQENLIPEVLEGADLTKQVNRAEFAAIAVKLYENLSESAAAAGANPFTDIAGNACETEILKAYNLDITAGTEETLFSPNEMITREQVATMLTRAYKSSEFDGWTLENDSQYYLNSMGVQIFADDNEISDYAKESVYFMVKWGVINGVGDNKFAPNGSSTLEENYGYATREQAIAIALRSAKYL